MISFGEFMIVAVSITAGCGTFIAMLLIIRDIILKIRGTGGGNASELRQLRDEVQRLRQQNTDVTLTLDSTLQTLDSRLARLEQQALPRQQQEETQYVRR